MGIELVAFWDGSMAVTLFATMTSTFHCTNSGRNGRESVSPFRRSNLQREILPFDVAQFRYPIRHTFPTCAEAGNDVARSTPAAIRKCLRWTQPMLLLPLEEKRWKVYA